MPVSKADVLKIAELAQLRIAPSRLTVFQEQLERIFLYMKRLDEVETGGVFPLIESQERMNTWRNDKPNPSLPIAEVLKNAPSTNEHFFSVPKVVQK